MQTLLYGAPELAELRVRNTRLVEMAHRAFQIVGVLSRASLALGDQPYLILEGQPSGILSMRTVDDEAKRIDPASISGKFNPLRDVLVDQRHLLARLQIAPRFFGPRGGNAEGDTPAGTTRIESENETRPFRRAAMNMAVDTEGPVIASEQRRLPLFMLEARPPHQRPVSKDPEILHAGGTPSRGHTLEAR